MQGNEWLTAGPDDDGMAARGAARRGDTARTRGIRTRLASLTAAALALVAMVGLGAASASAGPAPQLTSSVLAGAVTPTTNGLRIRSGPGTRYTAYGLLYRGDHMQTTVQEVLPGGEEWCWVRLTRRSASGLPKGFHGWVYAAYLRDA